MFIAMAAIAMFFLEKKLQLLVASKGVTDNRLLTEHAHIEALHTRAPLRRPRVAAAWQTVTILLTAKHFCEILRVCGLLTLMMTCSVLRCFWQFIGMYTQLQAPRNLSSCSSTTIFRVQQPSTLFIVALVSCEICRHRSNQKSLYRHKRQHRPTGNHQ